MTISAASSDLDNLRLHTLQSSQSVHAAYSLSALLVTGKGVDRSGGGVGGAKGGGGGGGGVGKKAAHGKKGEQQRRRRGSTDNLSNYL
jgi:hypothetical protein